VVLRLTFGGIQALVLLARFRAETLPLSLSLVRFIY
jgi:hypothetical protein